MARARRSVAETARPQQATNAKNSCGGLKKGRSATGEREGPVLRPKERRGIGEPRQINPHGGRLERLGSGRDEGRDFKSWQSDREGYRRLILRGKSGAGLRVVALRGRHCQWFAAFASRSGAGHFALHYRHDAFANPRGGRHAPRHWARPERLRQHGGEHRQQSQQSQRKAAPGLHESV